MTQSIPLLSRCQVNPRYTQKCFRTHGPSHQREMKFLGETHRANTFTLGMWVAPEGLLLLLFIKHSPLVLAIVGMEGWETLQWERGFLTHKGLNLNFRFLRNSSALDVKHPRSDPKMLAASWCQSSFYRCHELNQSLSILHCFWIPNNQLPKWGSSRRSLHLPLCFMLCGDHLPLS